MWSTPSSIARRRTARAASGSRGGPKTPGPASCMAPKPMRLTGLSPRYEVCGHGSQPALASPAGQEGDRSWDSHHHPPAARSSPSSCASAASARRPESVGLPANGRRRTPGLRREEVAQLAGVGLSWYTWLEQGRDITPSASVLDALARVLDLDPPEHGAPVRPRRRRGPGRRRLPDRGAPGAARDRRRPRSRTRPT